MRINLRKEPHNSITNELFWWVAALLSCNHCLHVWVILSVLGLANKIMMRLRPINLHYEKNKYLISLTCNTKQAEHKTNSSVTNNLRINYQKRISRSHLTMKSHRCQLLWIRQLKLLKTLLKTSAVFVWASITESMCYQSCTITRPLRNRTGVPLCLYFMWGQRTCFPNTDVIVLCSPLFHFNWTISNG